MPPRKPCLFLSLALTWAGCVAGSERGSATALDVDDPPDLTAAAPDADTVEAPDGDIGATETAVDAVDGGDATDALDAVDAVDVDDTVDDSGSVADDATTVDDATTQDTSVVATDALTSEVAVDVVASVDLPALGRALDDYLDHRYDAAADATTLMVHAIEQSGASFDQVEALIRGGRQSYPDVSALVGHVSERPLACDHVDYASSYFLAVPAGYDPSVATPVAVIAHGGSVPMDIDDARAAASDDLDAYRPELEARGMIVIAPVTTRGWSPIGDSVVFTALSDLSRHFHIDPDRIVVAGHLMGGHMTWRSAITQGDRYAAVAPASGGYVTWPDDGRLGNLFGSHGFQTWCATEPYDLRQANLLIRAWIVERGYDWRARDLAGDSHLPSEAMPDMAAFFAGVRRDMYPSDAYLWGGGSMRYDANWAGQTETIYSDRAYRWNERYWLELTPNPGASGPLEAFASVLDAHTLSIVSNHVRALRIYLHPDMGIDFSGSFRVIVNDQVRYDGPIVEDMAGMLELVREWDDRGRLYRGHVDVTVATDRVVGAPHADPDHDAVGP
ncbi:MAG: hypothetical protein U1F43_28165 [Myxococcota bacterium]